MNSSCCRETLNSDSLNADNFVYDQEMNDFKKTKVNFVRLLYAQ